MQKRGFWSIIKGDLLLYLIQMPHSKASWTKKTKQLPQKTSGFACFLEIVGRISVVLFVWLIWLFLVRQDSFVNQWNSWSFLFVFQGQPSDWWVESLPADVHGCLLYTSTFGRRKKIDVCCYYESKRSFVFFSF